jgi:hypothetical protein
MQTIRPSHTNLLSAARIQPRRAKPTAAAIASLALLAAGCRSSSPASPNAASPASFTTAAFKYSRCMRDHGLPSFPDPTMTHHDGQQVAYLTATTPIDPSPAFETAQNACRGILPPPINASPTQLAQQRDTGEQHLLAFAKCLRNHGVPDFPDPNSQGQLTLEMVNAAGVDLHAPTVLTAAKTCLGTTDGAITAADVQRALDGSQ